MDIGSVRVRDNQSNLQQLPFPSSLPKTLDDPQLSFPAESFQLQPQRLDGPPQQQSLQKRQFKLPFDLVQQSAQSSQFQVWNIATQQLAALSTLSTLPTLPIPSVAASHLPANKPSPSGKKNLPKWAYVCTAFILPSLIILVGYGIFIWMLSGKTQTSTAAVTQSKTTIVTHGTPHVGGPMSDFVGKYGQPTSQSFEKGQIYFGDTSHTIHIYAIADAHNQHVTFLAIVGPQSWSDVQTSTYCTQFLPSDIHEFNSASNLTDYHSSVGDVMLTMSGANMCMIHIAES